MRRFALNKLVTDEVFDEMKKIGQGIRFQVLDDDQFSIALHAKLREEIGELMSRDSDKLKEIRDVTRVFGQVLINAGTRLRAFQAFGLQYHSNFSERIFVEELRLDDGDPWADYYAGDPARFHEIGEE